MKNDFDIYFRTKDITKRVAQYYCNVFNNHNHNQTNKLVKFFMHGYWMQKT